MSDPWKACDIRGVVPAEVSPFLLRGVGAGVGSILPVGARVLVAGDFRTSTPVLKAALVEGLQSAGCKVLDSGQIPTPVGYFAHWRWGTNALMIVTASHNPPAQNGLKLMLGNLPLTPQGFLRLRSRVEKMDFRHHKGSYEIIDPVPAYKSHILERWNLLKSAGMTVVVDAGNGAWSKLGPELLMSLGFCVYPLFCKIDGNFPSRSPDCAKPNNLRGLREKVLKTGSEMGVAWDGDGDRVAFVDSSGAVVSPDEVSALMIRALVPREKGAKVIYDIKLSEIVHRMISECGGMPIMERSGHTFIRNAMIIQNGLFGCEMSGHYFFRELRGGDDGLFAALFMAGLIRERKLPLATLRRTLSPFFVTPDLRIPLSVVPYEEVIFRIRKCFPDSLETNIDGSRWETPSGFVLVRKSVTEPLFTLRIEGHSGFSFEYLLKICMRTLPEAVDEISKQIDHGAYT
jgi:phosphomannomutase / phosphoglucomutase